MKSSTSISAKRTLSKLAGLPARRRAFQFLAFVLALSLPAGIFHMACPFGGLETIGRLIEQGLYIPKTAPLNLYLLAAVALSAIAFGPVFCGWLCPLGSAQDWARALARRLGLKRALRPPKAVDKVLSLGRYASLALILFATQRSLSLAFLQADPYYALMHFWTGEVAPLALGTLGVVLVTSTIVERPWCRWLCPLGGVLSLLGKIRPFRLRRDAARCVGCGLCARSCPMGLDPSAKDVTKDLSCCSCGLCVEACPKPGALKSGPRFLPEIAAAFLLAAFVALPLIVGTEGRAQVFGGAHTAASVESGTDAWAELADGIGTRMSLDELVTKAVEKGIAEDALLEALGLPGDIDRDTKLRDLEDDYPGLSLGVLRDRLRRGVVQGEDPPGTENP